VKQQISATIAEHARSREALARTRSPSSWSSASRERACKEGVAAFRERRKPKFRGR